MGDAVDGCGEGVCVGGWEGLHVLVEIFVREIRDEHGGVARTGLKRVLAFV